VRDTYGEVVEVHGRIEGDESEAVVTVGEQLGQQLFDARDTGLQRVRIAQR
jgi:hypothetical protein